MRRSTGDKAPAVRTARPDSRRRPSDGLVIEASILARLLRIRLLTLEATVVVAPAEVTSGAWPVRSSGNGRGGLAEAVRTLDEGAAILADVRRAALPAGRR
jgi:hypothetical protein